MTWPIPSRQVSDFSLCGFRLRSDVHIENLLPWSAGTAPVTFEIRRGNVPQAFCDEPVGIFVGADTSATIIAADVGRFSVHAGTTVIADLDENALPGAVETTLLGPVLGALCYQRDILTLHSNTIVINGYAVALSGRSGAGKSTLAATLIARGHRLLSDDVLPLDRSGSAVLAIPGNQHLRLWRETLHAVGMTTEGLRRSAGGSRDKYFVPPALGIMTCPVPLKALVWLESGLSETQKLEQHVGALRTRTISKATYRRDVARAYVQLGMTGVGDLSMPGVGVYQFWRPRDLALLEGQADLIEALVS
jgi:hypothetical protein